MYYPSLNSMFLSYFSSTISSSSCSFTSVAGREIAKVIRTGVGSGNSSRFFIAIVDYLFVFGANYPISAVTLSERAPWHYPLLMDVL
jgi:hypothetical protein